ncbi:hypothetical protein, partial [uncultured Nisaea sp.]|uniref:hypothetical protein n=1 Tax=uncultured Nisaea sp. TaxID=538215 RepID=UPI0030EBF2EA
YTTHPDKPSNTYLQKNDALFKIGGKPTEIRKIYLPGIRAAARPLSSAPFDSNQRLTKPAKTDPAPPGKNDSNEMRASGFPLTPAY